MTDDEIIGASQAICDALSQKDNKLKKDVLGHLGNTWSLLVMQVLGVQGKMRFKKLLENVGGVSQKMLTRTLRELERDGLIKREVFAEVPVRVEYEITLLGKSLLIKILPLWSWIVERADEFMQARDYFERKT
jgi:DNA-binding HxlR family transcriptional regulator